MQVRPFSRQLDEMSLGGRILDGSSRSVTSVGARYTIAAGSGGSSGPPPIMLSS